MIYNKSNAKKPNSPIIPKKYFFKTMQNLKFDKYLQKQSPAFPANLVLANLFFLTKKGTSFGRSFLPRKKYVFMQKDFHSDQGYRKMHCYPKITNKKLFVNKRSRFKFKKINQKQKYFHEIKKK